MKISESSNGKGNSENSFVVNVCASRHLTAFISIWYVEAASIAVTIRLGILFGYRVQKASQFLMLAVRGKRSWRSNLAYRFIFEWEVRRFLAFSDCFGTAIRYSSNIGPQGVQIEVIRSSLLGPRFWYNQQEWVTLAVLIVSCLTRVDLKENASVGFKSRVGVTYWGSVADETQKIIKVFIRTPGSWCFIRAML